MKKSITRLAFSAALAAVSLNMTACTSSGGSEAASANSAESAAASGDSVTPGKDGTADGVSSSAVSVSSASASASVNGSPASALIPGRGPEEEVPEITFDPSENDNPDVYGPPDMFDEPEIEEFDPSENLNPLVYGPPEMFDNSDDAEDDITGNIPPSSNTVSSTGGNAAYQDAPELIYRPNRNINVAVYGPPEMFK